MLFLFGSVLIVAMATTCLNLQSVLLLSHNIQDVLFKNDYERYVTSGVIGRNKENNALVNSSSFIRLNGYIMVMFISDLHQ